MRLVLVHGINQQGKSEAGLKAEWLADLAAGLHRAFSAPVEAVAPFYGDRLAELTDARAVAVAQGADDGGTAEARFLAQALEEQAIAAGATGAEMRAEETTVAPQGAVPQSFPMDRRINALVRVLERLSPFHGGLVLQLLRQAYAYLKTPAAGSAVDAIVRPVLDAGPAIVVSHSLGTVVAFKLLRQLALEGRPLQVPLLVTLGSPLSLMTVRAALGPAFTSPEGVGHWLNGIDPNDFIGLGQGLIPPSFAAGIENLLDINNGPDDPHAIKGYLADRRVAAAIAAASAI